MKRCLFLTAVVSAASLTAQIDVISNGNVGIGTSTPSVNLEVSAATNPRVDVRTVSGATTRVSSTATQGYVGMTTNHPLNLIANDTVYATLTPSGNLGLGTTAPQTTLHVQSASAGATALRLTDSMRATLNIDFPALSKLRFNVGAAEDYLFASGGTTVMTIKDINSGGNVGIGTTSPGYKLEVAGSVRATSFISNSTTYADFVFKPDYRLAPLREVEVHIAEHGHLPGVPSEAQAMRDGIDLAAMQVKLLQKVEELTLHAIAQEKEIEGLKRQLAALSR